MANIEEKVQKLVENRINELGYELYDVEYVKEGKNYYLRIFIDSEKGIDLDDCEKVNDGIMDLLDEADYIKEQYFLEISSPGIERVLRKDKHLETSIGLEVEANLFEKVDNKKKIDGILKKFDDENIIIESQGNDIEIARKNISLLKQKYNWN